MCKGQTLTLRCAKMHTGALTRGAKESEAATESQLCGCVLRSRQHSACVTLLVYTCHVHAPRHLLQITEFVKAWTSFGLYMCPDTKSVRTRDHAATPDLAVHRTACVCCACLLTCMVAMT